METKFFQYYYSSAMNLFNTGRNYGWGIFGSSMPEKPELYGMVERLARDMKPAKTAEEHEVPVYYTFFSGERYVLGVVIPYHPLIKGDERPNVFVHILCPEKQGVETFKECLGVDFYKKQDFAEGSEKQKLENFVIEREFDERKEALTWTIDKECYLLEQFLEYCYGNQKPILIENLDREKADSFMGHVFDIVEGELREKLNYVVPYDSNLIHDRTPGFISFYFGKDEKNILQAQRLQTGDFEQNSLMRACLYQMMRLKKERPEEYHNIGKDFRVKGEIDKGNYIWHYFFKTLEADLKEYIPLEYFNGISGMDDYKRVRQKAGRQEKNQKAFLELTKLLCRAYPDKLNKDSFFEVFLRFVKNNNNRNIDEEIVKVTANWIISRGKEKRDLAELENYELYEKIKCEILSDNRRKEESKEKLERCKDIEDCKSWFKNNEWYVKQLEFQEVMERKLSEIYRNADEEEKICAFKFNEEKYKGEFLQKEQKELKSKIQSSSLNYWYTSDELCKNFEEYFEKYERLLRECFPDLYDVVVKKWKENFENYAKEKTNSERLDDNVIEKAKRVGVDVLKIIEEKERRDKEIQKEYSLPESISVYTKIGTENRKKEQIENSTSDIVKKRGKDSVKRKHEKKEPKKEMKGSNTSSMQITLLSIGIFEVLRYIGWHIPYGEYIIFSIWGVFALIFALCLLSIIIRKKNWSGDASELIMIVFIASTVAICKRYFALFGEISSFILLFVLILLLTSLKKEE